MNISCKNFATTVFLTMAALLYSTPTFTMEINPVSIVINNSTDYTLSSGGQTIAPHTIGNFNTRISSQEDTTRFHIRMNNNNITNMQLILMTNAHPLMRIPRVQASLQISMRKGIDSNIIYKAENHQTYLISINLEGNANNNFAGSSISLQLMPTLAPAA